MRIKLKDVADEVHNLEDVFFPPVNMKKELERRVEK